MNCETQFSMKRLVFHPFLFALFSVLAMLAYNMGEMVINEALRTLIFALVASFILLCLAYYIVRPWQHATLWSSLCLLLFFSYGHIYEALDTVKVGGVLLGWHRYLIPVRLLIFGLGTWWICRRARDSADPRADRLLQRHKLTRCLMLDLGHRSRQGFWQL
jgi:hypothetical protein